MGCFPSCRRASLSANVDPTVSPSGRGWAMSRACHSPVASAAALLNIVIDVVGFPFAFIHICLIAFVSRYGSAG